MSSGSYAGRVRVGVLSLPDDGSSDAGAEPFTREVLRATGAGSLPVVLEARAYLNVAGRRMAGRVDSGRRVRPVDSLRLEATRLLAGLTSELGDLEDLFVVADRRSNNDVYCVAVVAAAQGGSSRALLAVEPASDPEEGLFLTTCEVTAPHCPPGHPA